MLKHLIIMVLIGAHVVFSQEKAPVGESPIDIKLPESFTLELSNKMKITLVPNGFLPKISLKLTIKVGTANETENEYGIASLLGEILKEASAQKSKDMDAIGGSLDISVLKEQTTITATSLNIFSESLLEDWVRGSTCQYQLAPERGGL